MSDDFGLPPFPAFHIDELREMWRATGDEQVHRLLLEVERYRRVLSEVETLRLAVDRAWHDEAKGQLVALYRLRVLLQKERERIGILAKP